MGTFFKQPVGDECCPDPCADRSSPCTPCTDCTCPEIWSACNYCPRLYEIEPGEIEWLETLSATYSDLIQNRFWTWFSIPFLYEWGSPCMFDGNAEETEPCEAALQFKFSDVFGWWAGISFFSGDCFEDVYLWGSPQYGCDDDLEASILWKDGVDGSDIYLEIEGL